MARETERTIFSLVPGRYHSAWHWQFLQRALSERGWDSIAPNLATYNPNLSLDDHARQLDEEERASDAERVIRVGWSWGANVIPRALSEEPVKSKLVFIAGVFHPSTLPHVPAADFPEIERSDDYERVKSDPNRYLEGLAGNTFYSDIRSPILRGMAVENLHAHPDRLHEPPVASWPDIPMAYLRTTEDRTVSYACQTLMARLALVSEIEDLATGHAPMLSRPLKLAHALIRHAQEWPV